MSQLLQTAAAGTVLILVTAALRLALKKRLPPEVWLVLWTVCLFRLLTPAVPESPLSLYGLPRLLTSEAPPVQTAPLPVQPDWSAPPGEVFGPVSPAPPASPVPPAAPSWNWEAVLAAVWLLGAAALAVRYALDWVRTRLLVRSATLLPPSDPRYTALPPGVRLREGPVKGAPFTFGVVRPTVVLSPNLSGAALACVLAHEGIHARRRDNLWHYAVALACALFWWDPAVWLMAKLLRRDIELSCDRAALRRLGLHRRREYAMTILDLSTQGEGAPFSRAFGQKQAEERILAVMKYKKMTVLVLVLSILLVCGVTMAFATKPVDDIEDPAPTETEPVETEPVETEPVETDPLPAAPARFSFWKSGAELDPAGPGFTIPTRVFIRDKEGARVDFAELGIIVPPAPEGTPEDMLRLWESALVMGQYTALTSGSFHADPEGADPAPHSPETCPHLHQTPGVTHSCATLSDSVHGRVRIVFMHCDDCGNIAIQLDEAKIWTEEHYFDPGKYLGADHSAADPAEHYYLYEHTCITCNATYEYMMPAACTESGCADIAAVGDLET